MQRQQNPVSCPLGAAIGYSRAVRAGALVYPDLLVEISAIAATD
jgi:hypothetical protein